MRLIDVDKFEEKNAKVWRQFGRESSYYSVGYILSQASVDAVPVIRCKDCKYYDGKWCKLHAISDFDLNDVMKSADDFCSYAERKEE